MLTQSQAVRLMTEQGGFQVAISDFHAGYEVSYPKLRFEQLHALLLVLQVRNGLCLLGRC